MIIFCLFGEMIEILMLPVIFFGIFVGRMITFPIEVA